MVINLSKIIDITPGIGLLPRYFKVERFIKNKKEMLNNKEIPIMEYLYYQFWGTLDIAAFTVYHVVSFRSVLDQLYKKQKIKNLLNMNTKW